MSGMHIGGLRFNQLQLIEALARTGNITDAAKHIGITQPAASHALARLRRSMRDPIFIRTSEGMKPAGECLALGSSCGFREIPAA